MILEHIETVNNTPYFKWIHLDTGKIFLEYGWDKYKEFTHLLECHQILENL